MRVADKNRDTRTIAALALVCFVLQLALAPNVGIGSGRANFALVFVLGLTLVAGGTSAVVAGFLAGLVFDLSTTGPIGLMAFCLSVTSFVLAGVSRERVAGDFVAALARGAVASLAVSLVYHLAMLLVGQSPSIVDALVMRALPTALLTLVMYLPFAYLLSRTRGAGSSLGRRRGASHLGGKGL